jgi:hypothetical protein
MTPEQQAEVRALCEALNAFVAKLCRYLDTAPALVVSPPHSDDAEGLAQRWAVLQALWDRLPADERRQWLIERLTPSERRAVVKGLEHEEGYL